MDYQPLENENLIPEKIPRPYAPALVRLGNQKSELSKSDLKEQSIASFNAGIALEDKGKYKEALLAYSIATASDPTNAKAWVNRSNVKRTLGDLKGALEDAQEAVKLDPKDALAFHSKAQTLIAQKKYSEAILELDRGIAIRGDILAQLYQARGHANAKAGRLELAVADTKKAMELDPNEEELYCNLAIFYARQGNNEAMFQIEKAHKLAPEAPCVKELWAKMKSAN
ncbi:MAG: tetratricopeptide repeat protein [Bdellovibrionaceae bacterium]|nr:tetratricopeptide repeat protein [Pseudobdellovibrionaceae bacterium]